MVFCKFSSVVVAFTLITSGFSSAIPRRALTENDIIVFGNDGRLEVMNKADYLAATKFATGPPVQSMHNESSSGVSSSPSILSRACKSETIFTLNPDQTFLNWDVPMSSVVKAGSTTASVAVTQGYSIANAVSVSASATFQVVEAFLSAAFSVSYTQTWTSTYASAYTFTVPAGKYGAVVSNPATVRRSGFIDQGCIGSAKRSSFSADSYNSKAYGGLSWVDGTISLCVGDSYPLKMCIGDSTIS